MIHTSNVPIEDVRKYINPLTTIVQETTNENKETMLSIMKLLFKHNIDCNKQDKNGPPFVECIKKYLPHFLEIMAQHNLNINNSGWKPFFDSNNLQKYKNCISSNCSIVDLLTCYTPARDKMLDLLLSLKK
jgi:hypothetical protein